AAASRPLTMTVCPASASAWAVARPMPLVLPVMRAIDMDRTPSTGGTGRQRMCCLEGLRPHREDARVLRNVRFPSQTFWSLVYNQPTRPGPAPMRAATLDGNLGN